MKRAYVTPEVEKIEFQYRDQVVVASGYDSACATPDFVFHWAPYTGEDTKCHEKTYHHHQREYPCDYTERPPLGLKI